MGGSDIPVAGRVVMSNSLEREILKYRNRTDTQGKLILKQLLDTKEIVDG